jgi:hypothetical protein
MGSVYGVRRLCHRFGGELACREGGAVEGDTENTGGAPAERVRSAKAEAEPPQSI